VFIAPQINLHPNPAIVVFDPTHERLSSKNDLLVRLSAHLTEKLQGLSYEIAVDPRTRAPEIKGFSEEYLQESSPRREEVIVNVGFVFPACKQQCSPYCAYAITFLLGQPQTLACGKHRLFFLVSCATVLLQLGG
jgi:hypothetical protein